MILAVVFTISYQSLHILFATHHHHSETKISTSNHHFKITEKEDCSICDFHFAAFLKSDFVTFTFKSLTEIKSKISIYNSYVKSEQFVLFSHRGPPTIC